MIMRNSCGHLIESESMDHVSVHVFVFVSDLYLCAVLICCVGLLCMFMFTTAVGCQYLLKKRHLKGTREVFNFTSQCE